MSIIQCPSCGGTNEIKNPGITMIACKYCRSTLYWNDEAVIHAGEKAVLPEKDALLWLGARGRIQNHPFEVLGRLRLAGSRGLWDEWFISYDQGFAWLGEMARQFTLRQIIPDGEAVLGRQRPLLGGDLLLHGQALTIREADRAQCMTIEGELPFNVPPQEALNYFNATSGDGQYSAQLSFNQAGRLRLTLGEPLAPEALVLSGGESLESQYNHLVESRNLTCAGCGAPLPLTGQNNFVTLTCPGCGALNNIGCGPSRLCGKNSRQDDAAKMTLAIGEEVTAGTDKYPVCGRQLLENKTGESLQLYLLQGNREYLYYFIPPTGQPRIMGEVPQAPSGHAHDWLGWQVGDQLTFAGSTYQVSSHELWQLRYVDGAFPWLVTVGEEYNWLWADRGSDHHFLLQKSATRLQFLATAATSEAPATSAAAARSLTAGKARWPWALLGGILVLVLLALVFTSTDNTTPATGETSPDTSAINNAKVLDNFHFFKETAYPQLKEAAAAQPVDEWHDRVQALIEKWPTQEKRLLTLKNDRDTKRQELLALFTKIDKLTLTEETLPPPDGPAAKLLEQYSAALADYEVANNRLESAVENLEKKE